MKTELLLFNSKTIKELEESYLPPESGDGWSSDSRIFRSTIWRLKQLDCKYIVIEDDYIDRDFSEDYSAFYSGIFDDTGKYCTRLHFFKDCETELPFGTGNTRIVTPKEVAQIDKNYCGFMVLLPLSKSVIGRTIIKPNCTRDYEYYCTTKTEIKINLEGVPLKAKGVPFIQQDGHVGVCSTTAIWMISRIMHLKYGFERYSLSGITSAANKYLRINREFPAIRGLTVEQIISGAIELGYAPLAYQKATFTEKTWDPKEIIYKYIESGIPVIVVLGNKHASVVIGHDFKTNKSIVKDGSLVSNSVFINSFVVHDDALGPYMLMPEKRVTYPGMYKYEVNGEYEPFKEDPNLYTPYTIEDITHIIIPSFKKVYIEGQQIEDQLRNILLSEQSMFRYYYENECKENGNSELSIATLENAKIFMARCDENNEQIYYRTRCLLSNDLKIDYFLSKKSIPSVVGHRVSKLSLPRYVWLIELCYIEHIINGADSKNGERRIIGEIIIDATSNDDILSIVCTHFPGYLITNVIYDVDMQDDSETMLGVYAVPDDCAYESFDRSRRVLNN